MPADHALDDQDAPLVASRPPSGHGAHALRLTPDAGADSRSAAAEIENDLATTRVVVTAPRHRIQRRAAVLWTLEGFWSWALLGALQVAWYYYGDNVMAFWNWVALVVTVPLALINIVVAPWWRYAVARWDVSDTAVCSRTGWWTTHLRIAPLSRLQTVYTTRNLAERIMGLATVHASTASAHGSVQIRGVLRADADRLGEHLISIAELDQGDAT